MLWVCFCKSNNPTKKNTYCSDQKAKPATKPTKKTIIVKIKIPKQATKPTKNPVQKSHPKVFDLFKIHEH